MNLLLKKRFAAVLKALIPQNRVTIMSQHAIPSSIAATIDVDRVHEILRAAEAGDVQQLFQLYQDIIISDSHLQGRLTDRKEAVLSDTLNILPFNKKDADDVAAAEAIKEMIADCDDWEKGCAHLLDSHLYPLSIVEKTFRPSSKPGRRYDLAELTPVPYQLIQFFRGYLEILPTDPATGYPLASTGVPPETTRYIIHRGHLLTGITDNWGGPMRSLIFWWLLSMMDRDWWARFLDRYGSPFMVGKYDQADDTSRTVLERAFSLAVRLGGLVVSKETEVEIKQAAASDSGEAYKTFIELCNQEKSKLILGETLSSDAQSTGMNSGNAKLHGEKRSDKRKADGRRLGATLRSNLFAQYLRINNIPGRAPIAVWGSISSVELEALAELLTALTAGGLRIADTGLELLSEQVGFPIERAPATAAMPGGQFGAFASNGLRAGWAQNAADLIAEGAAANLAKTFRGELAPIRGIILNAKSADEAIKGVEAFCAKFDATKSARVMEEVMLAMAANGSVATR
ncbi:MAG TPA: DUF935 family protein [Rariglobus sp.]|jgi:phage gp29-like protein|nr:DUF935 family protein [Rariglobus sp.]